MTTRDKYVTAVIERMEERIMALRVEHKLALAHARLVEVICEQEVRLRDSIAPVRADERRKAWTHATGTSTGDGPCCQCCYDVLRAQIAADIDQGRDNFVRVARSRPGGDRPLSLSDEMFMRVYDDAARIARGEKP